MSENIKIFKIIDLFKFIILAIKIKLLNFELILIKDLKIINSYNKCSRDVDTIDSKIFFKYFFISTKEKDKMM